MLPSSSTSTTTTTTTTTASGLVREQLHQYGRLVSAFIQALLASPASSAAATTPAVAAAAAKKGANTPSSTTPDEIMEQILQTDQALLRALQQLREHQRQQQRLAQLREEVEKKDQVVEQLALQLRQVQAILQRVIDDTSVKLARPSGRNGASSGVDVDEVVAYAHKVSYTTSAPPNWNPNLPHMRMFQPPAPLEINILQGNYYHNTTTVPLPDFSDLSGEGPLLRKTTGPELPALPASGPGGLAPQPVAAPALIPMAELPPAPPVSAEPMGKQITLDLNPGEDEDEDSDLEDEDDW